MDYFQYSACVNLVESYLKITEVVSSYANLKKAGEYYRCRCLFHEDDGESLIVNPETGTFYCPVCHAGGNALKFFAMAEKISLFDAIERQSKKFKLELYPPKVNFEEATFEAKQRELAEIYEYSSNFYHEILTDTAEGNVCRKYLKSRGISNFAIEKFNIGFVAKADKKLTRFLYDYNFNVGMILESGLIFRDENLFDDKFQDCIVFPFLDPIGNKLALIGRVFNFEKKVFYESESVNSKYIYPDETPAFNKKNLIFGLNAAKKSSEREGSMIIAEDCLDAVILSSAGIENVVAVPENNLDSEIAKHLTNYAKRVIFCLKYGDKLQLDEKIIKAIASGAGTIFIAALPKNPAEYLEENGKDALLEYIKKPLRFEEYEFSQRIFSQKANIAEDKILTDPLTHNNSFISNKRAKNIGIVFLKLAYHDTAFLKYIAQIILPEMFKYEPHKEIFRYLKICIDEEVEPDKEDAMEYLDKESYKEFLKISGDSEVAEEIKATESDAEAELYLNFKESNLRDAAEDAMDILLNQKNRLDYGTVRNKDIKSYNELCEKLNNLQVIKSEEGY